MLGRQGLMLFLVAIAFVAAGPATADGQAPGFAGEPEGLVPVGDATGGSGAGQRLGGETPARGTPAVVRSRTRCRSRRRGGRRIRTCKTYRNGVLIRRCTKRGNHKRKCRSLKPGARAATAAGPTATSSALRSHNYQNPPVPAVGRFYYQGRGWCSGTMLFRGIVLTAGHCLANIEAGQGYYAPSDLKFVPGNTWDGSKAIGNYGVWDVSNAWITTSYAQNGSNGYDWGLALLAPDSTGRYAGDYVGTFPSYGSVRLTGDTEIIRMGYPASGPWTDLQYQGGNGQYFCRENFDQVEQNPALGVVWLHFRNGCPMNGGSSGGPNFVRFGDGSFGVVGVNNRGCGPCPYNPNNAISWGEQANNIWFDQSYVDFVNAVVAIVNGQAQATRRGHESAVSVASLIREKELRARR